MMIAISVVLPSPDLEDEDKSEAAEAEDDVEAVFETVVTRAMVDWVIVVVIERGVEVARLTVEGATSVTDTTEEDELAMTAEAEDEVVAVER